MIVAESDVCVSSGRLWDFELIIQRTKVGKLKEATDLGESSFRHVQIYLRVLLMLWGM